MPLVTSSHSKVLPGFPLALAFTSLQICAGKTPLPAPPGDTVLESGDEVVFDAPPGDVVFVSGDDAFDAGEVVDFESGEVVFELGGEVVFDPAGEEEEAVLKLAGD